jgi:general secretion pathway protein K
VSAERSRRGSFHKIPQEGTGSKTGFALIVVLWFLVLLAAVGTYMLANARSETALAHNVIAAAHAQALADSGIAEAVFHLTDPAPEKNWALDGRDHVLHLDEGELTIRLRDEGEKINPNIAAEPLVAALFTTVGTDPGQAARLAAAIADWVDTDDDVRPLGAEKDQYHDAGLPYGPANAPFESLDELALVFGMTPAILAAARPYLSIHTQTDRPDGVNAADPVLRALAMVPADSGQSPAQTAPGQPAQPAPDQPSSDQPSAEPGSVAQPTPGAAPAAPGAAPGQPGQAQAPPEIVVDIESTAHSKDGAIFDRRAVVRLDDQQPKGYVVLEWGRGERVE